MINYMDMHDVHKVIVERICPGAKGAGDQGRQSSFSSLEGAARAQQPSQGRLMKYSGASSHRHGEKKGCSHCCFPAVIVTCL